MRSFQIAAAQIRAVLGASAIMTTLAQALIDFVLLVAVMAEVLALGMTLPADQGCTLAFSLRTRAHS